MIKKRSISFRVYLDLVLLLICVICAAIPAFAAGSAGDLYCEIDNEKISVLNVDGAKYLFLPSEAATEMIAIYDKKNGEESHYKLSDSKGNLWEAISPVSLSADENGVRKIEVYSQNEDDDLYEHVCDINVMCGENIGTVYIHSSDPVNKGRSYVDKSKENGQPGSAYITDSTGDALYDGGLEQIRPRGSSSFKYFDKKAYQIKLEDKAALIEGTQKGKTWVLVAAADDCLKLNDYLGKELASYGGEQYAPAETPVNLYYDGEYRGVYLLSEKNQIKSNRIDITDMEEYYEEKYSSYGDKVNIGEAYNRYGNKFSYQKGLSGPDDKGGYLIEMSGVDADENNQFILKSGMYVNIKSPELGSKASVAYISEYMQEFEDAIRAVDSNGNHTGRNPYTGLYYYDYCDIDSLINEYMIQTILSNGDGFIRSGYFYKDKGSIMYCGPVWDTDLILGMGWNFGTESDFDRISYSWAAPLLKIPGFRNELHKAWVNKYSKLTASMTGEGDAMPSLYDYADTLRPNVMMDYVLWPDKYKLVSPKAGYPGKTDEEKDWAYVKAGRKDNYLCWDDSMSYDDILEVRMAWLREHRKFLEGYFAGMGTAHVHQLGEVTASDGTSHTRICTTCGAEVKEDCVYLAAPVGSTHHTAKRTCMVCGNSTRGDTKCSFDILEEQAATKKRPKIISRQCSICRQTTVIEKTLSKGETFSKGDLTYEVLTKDKYVKVIAAKNVSTVVIPGTVTYGGITYNVRSVGKGAFRKKTKLESIQIGRNVRVIGRNAFRGCTRLKTVTGISKVTTIYSYAFYGDYRLTKVTSLRSCRSIGKKAFYGCKKLKKIGSKKSGIAALNKKVKVGKRAFRKSGIKKLRKIL